MSRQPAAAPAVPAAGKPLWGGGGGEVENLGRGGEEPAMRRWDVVAFTIKSLAVARAA